MESSLAIADDVDNFKAVFKHYKRRDQKLELSGVVDVDQSEENQLVSCIQPTLPNCLPICGIAPVQEWKIYHFVQNKGFYLIRNPFLPGFQRYWVSRCLRDLAKPPNITNLRVHPEVNPNTMWSNFVTQQQNGKPFDHMSPLRKLRWTTIGYHYNWDTKEYKESNHTTFPEDIGLLSQYTAEALGFQNFAAEAGIINYYHLDSTLAGHTDHSELDHQAPLISISFGQDAIFLLGGLTKATEPTAILLRSGDICVMSGSSRLAFHAVPRILPPADAKLPACFEPFLREVDRAPARSVPKSCEKCIISNVEKVGESQKRSGAKGATAANFEETELMPSVMTNAAAVLKCCETCIMSKQDVSCVIKEVEFQEKSGAKEHKGDSSAACGNLLILSGGDTSDSSREKLKNIQCSCSGSVARNCSCNKTGVPNISCQECDKTVDQNLPHNECEQKSLEVLSQKSTASAESNQNNLVAKVNALIVDTLEKLHWEPFSAYLKSSRINVNVRQVLKPSQTFQRTYQMK